MVVEKAKVSANVLLPGYTHMRRGQPVVFAQYLLAWFWALERDRARLTAAGERALELPLGAGALAGNPFGVDRNRLARELGFPTVLPNSIDAVSSRDYALEFLSSAAILGVNLSRMAEDLILWSGAEYSFVSFDESYATGSSLMPQKQNPDGLELVRGKTGRLLGDSVSLLTTVKGLATGYQRDLQEDKEPVFDALDTLNLTLPVMEGVIGSLVVREEQMAKALSFDLLATDLAEYLGAGKVFPSGAPMASWARCSPGPKRKESSPSSFLSKTFERCPRSSTPTSPPPSTFALPSKDATAKVESPPGRSRPIFAKRRRPLVDDVDIDSIASREFL